MILGTVKIRWPLRIRVEKFQSQLRPDRAGGDSGPSPAPAPPPCLIASTYIYVWLRERGGTWGYTHT
jgi:hypothetical protein